MLNKLDMRQGPHTTRCVSCASGCAPSGWRRGRRWRRCGSVGRTPAAAPAPRSALARLPAGVVKQRISLNKAAGPEGKGFTRWPYARCHFTAPTVDPAVLLSRSGLPLQLRAGCWTPESGSTPVQIVRASRLHGRKAFRREHTGWLSSKCTDAHFSRLAGLLRLPLRQLPPDGLLLRQQVLQDGLPAEDDAVQRCHRILRAQRIRRVDWAYARVVQTERSMLTPKAAPDVP